MEQFSINDVYTMIRKVEYPEDAILVGGQALNFWASKYEYLDQSISEFAPFTSKDIDFLGGIEAAILLHDAFHGEIFTPSIDDHTPETAKVILTINEKKVVIDFLSTLHGLDERHVSKLAGVINIPNSNKELRVMHPFHCLKAQLSNVYGALRRRQHPDGDYQAMRVKLAIKVLKECLNETINRDVRDGYDLIEEIAELSKIQTAKEAYFQDKTDVLDAIVDHPKLSKEFREIRLPQIHKEVSEKRKSYEKIVKRREAIQALADT